jgi:hypothetical protein
MSTPSWLADFQARFGSVLRAPLDRTSGTLTATTSAYDRALVADVKSSPTSTREERLAIYHRQYWFRLFEVMQTAFPLTSQLMGYWSFNDVAAKHLVAQPPRSWDLDDAADGFETFFEGVVEADPTMREALIESARIDAAYRLVFRAPAVAPYVPSASDAARLLEGRLVTSPALRVVTEHRALVALRRTLFDGDRNAALALPAIHEVPQIWAIQRTERGTTHLALEPREAELIALLGQHPVGVALANLEQLCPEEERARLPDDTRIWLARSVERGFWTDLD